MAVNMCIIMSSRTVFAGSRLLNLTSPKCPKFSSNVSVINSSNVSDTFVRQKYRQFMDWYEEFTGLKDVRLAQEKVLKAQDHFITVQDTRRDINKQLSAVRDRLKEIYSELDQTTRGEDRYVLLITQEHKVLKEERKLLERFNQSEQEEREYFSLLASAVKESHEKERIQAERTKYWSIIGSVIGTVLGVAGSSINNEFKMRELRKLVQDTALANLSSYQGGDALKEISAVSKEMQGIVQKFSQESVDMLVLNKIQDQNSMIQHHIVELQKSITHKPHLSPDGMLLNVDQLLDAQRKENRILAVIVLVATCSLLVMSKLRS